jgi:prophage tail gpP-like protein
LPRYLPLLVPVEHPGTKEDVRKRTKFSHDWHETTFVDCEITVQGWLQENGDLWRIESWPHVRSPMAMLDQKLGIHIATFLQDNEGGTARRSSYSTACRASPTSAARHNSPRRQHKNERSVNN